VGNWQIAFDDMKVPVANLVEEGEGLKLAQK
jgi:alkylation response protein AidB-like acyl-CoA dehydrogenase